MRRGGSDAMLTGGPKDQKILQYYRDDLRREADSWQMTHAVGTRGPRRKRRVLVVIVALLAVFAAYQGVYAASSAGGGSLMLSDAAALTGRGTIPGQQVNALQRALAQPEVAVAPVLHEGRQRVIHSRLERTLRAALARSAPAHEGGHLYTPYLLLAMIATMLWGLAQGLARDAQRDALLARARAV